MRTVSEGIAATAGSLQSLDAPPLRQRLSATGGLSTVSLRLKLAAVGFEIVQLVKPYGGSPRQRI
jgi:hypothetical protein